MKFCCWRFEGGYYTGNGFAPNIRVIKFTSPHLISDKFSLEDDLYRAVRKGKRNDLRFFITFGYEKFDFDVVGTMINYCPYCGTNLYKFYDKDEYVNEIEGETFTL